MKYRFLIYIAHSYAFPIGVPLQKEILQRGYEVKWFSEKETPKSCFPQIGMLLNSIPEVIAYQPHIVLTIHDTVPDFIPGLKVQIFHGFPANKRKGIDQFTIRGFFDLYCTQGPSSTSVFKKLSEKLKNFEVIETGWSKVDPLFPLATKPPGQKPVILIASTFTKKYSLALKDKVVEELYRLSKLGKWHFMAVLHPKLEASVYQKFEKLQHKNFTFHNTPYLIPLFKTADVMFSDTTSALIEFLLQEKPVVTYQNNMPGPYLLDISEVSEIEPALELALSKPDFLMQEINKYSHFSHSFQDGKSSARVIDACIQYLHQDKSHLKKKPWNLLRKYKIRKRLKFFTWKSYKVPTFE